MCGWSRCWLSQSQSQSRDFDNPAHGSWCQFGFGRFGLRIMSYINPRRIAAGCFCSPTKRFWCQHCKRKWLLCRLRRHHLYQHTRRPESASSPTPWRRWGSAINVLIKTEQKRQKVRRVMCYGFPAPKGTIYRPSRSKVGFIGLYEVPYLPFFFSF